MQAFFEKVFAPIAWPIYLKKVGNFRHSVLPIFYPIEWIADNREAV
jgi:hypothetical protein